MAQNSNTGEVQHLEFCKLNFLKWLYIQRKNQGEIIAILLCSREVAFSKSDSNFKSFECTISFKLCGYAGGCICA